MWQGDDRELSRISSPDARLEAIILEDGGSGVKNGILIFLEPAGTKIADYDACDFSADKVHGLSVRWISAKVLEIHYAKARIFEFRNIWTSKELELNPGVPYPAYYTVEIKLIKDGEEELDVIHD
jgi:hypothetical protein